MDGVMYKDVGHGDLKPNPTGFSHNLHGGNGVTPEVEELVMNTNCSGLEVEHLGPDRLHGQFGIGAGLLTNGCPSRFDLCLDPFAQCSAIDLAVIIDWHIVQDGDDGGDHVGWEKRFQSLKQFLLNLLVELFYGKG